MDINCGVRLLRTSLEAKSLDKPLLRKLLHAIVERVPTGVGKKSRQAALVRNNLKEMLVKGVPFLIEQGFGRPEDLECIEEGGAMNGADPAAVSPEAVERGAQLSTIGGGNHFIELGLVEKVFDSAAAAKLGLAEGQLSVMIHTGSRGFGHQICTDYTALMWNAAARLKLEIPTKGLAAVPIKSAEGQRYLEAMACAVNFAFCNRQWITHDVRQAFSAVLGGDDRDYDLGLVYDVAHNIAKFEELRGKRLLIHRKGATRALPPGHPNNPPLYRDLRPSGLDPGKHGDGILCDSCRAQSRAHLLLGKSRGRPRPLTGAARREIEVEELKKSLGEIMVLGRNYREYLDEAPQACRISKR